jgi:preprotein translocase subunit SecE
MLFKMERIKLYLSESYDELINNVTWPTWENLQQTAIVVMGSTVVVAFLIFLMDLISNQFTKLIYNL